MGALAILGLVVVLVALQRDDAVDLPAPRAPDWGPLPSRSDLARTDFPLRVPGYDPASVDLALEALADAYGDLLAEADPATIERARRRAEARLGLDRQAEDDGLDTVLEPVRSDGGEQADAVLPAATEAELNRDALRTEVALDTLRRSTRRG